MRNIARLGVTSKLSPTFAKRIILTNLLGMLFTANMSCSALAFLYFGQYKLAIFTFLFVISEASWPVFNHFGHYNISRVGMLVTSNLLGLAVSVLLPDTGYNRGFYVMAGLPILLFGLKERKFIVLGLLLPLLLYPFSEWAQYHVPVSLDLSAQATEVIRYAIGTIYVLLIFLMFLFLSAENARSEELLEEQRARSFSSAKFAALGEMAAGIGHEINNPMMAIDLNAEHLRLVLAQPEFDRQKALQKVEAIKRTTHRAARIVDAMRSFSREGSNDPFVEVAVSKVVEETLTLCAERFKNHNIRLEVVYPPETASLRCRPVQVEQIILNLLNNAFDAVEPLQDRWIRLEAQIDSRTGRLRISVTDSGDIIPEGEHEKIFQPFYTTKPVGKGTGLGLSLSRKIAQDHGGELYLDLTSMNTRFLLELPLNA